jgi:hypothetical protein
MPRIHPAVLSAPGVNGMGGPRLVPGMGLSAAVNSLQLLAIAIECRTSSRYDWITYLLDWSIHSGPSHRGSCFDSTVQPWKQLVNPIINAYKKEWIQGPESSPQLPQQKWWEHICLIPEDPSLGGSH